MACALFAYVGAVTKSVVTSSFTCEWETTAQWAQALTEEGLLAVLEEFAKDKDPIEGFAEDEDPIVEAIAELHRRLLTDEGALRLEPTARAAAIVLRSLRRAVALASSEQILAELDEGRWPSEASLLLRCARLAKAVAPTLDLPTGAEELVRDVILGLAPVLRPMSAGVIANPIDPRRPAPSLGLLTCDAIAGLLEWGRRALPELATTDDGILIPLTEYLLWKGNHGLTAGPRGHLCSAPGPGARPGEGLRPRGRTKDPGAGE